MKYLIVGAGGVGGTLAGLMRLGGIEHVDLIARGESLEAMREGITFIRNGAGEDFVTGARVFSQEEYLETGEHPDVLFLCVKTYSVEDVAPFLQKAAGPETVIIPLMNGIRTGDLVRRYVHDRHIADGCIYVYARKDGPGRFWMDSKILRIVFGSDDPGVDSRILKQAEAELAAAGIRVQYAENIEQETLKKFSRSVVRKSNDRETWALTSGPLDEAWASWYVHEFLMAEQIWIGLNSSLLTLNSSLLWLPCHVVPEETTVLEDREKAQPLEVLFRLEMDINGSPL